MTRDATLTENAIPRLQEFPESQPDDCNSKI